MEYKEGERVSIFCLKIGKGRKKPMSSHEASWTSFWRETIV
jgi:hypothetical protein